MASPVRRSRRSLSCRLCQSRSPWCGPHEKQTFCIPIQSLSHPLLHYFRVRHSSLLYTSLALRADIIVLGIGSSASASRWLPCCLLWTRRSQKGYLMLLVQGSSTSMSTYIPNLQSHATTDPLLRYYNPAAQTPEVGFPIQEVGVSNEPASHDHDHDHILSNISSSKKSSPDTCLTAFAQLVAWRLGAQRAMISLIDAETQYFVAESTRTLDLVDNTRHAPGDDLWIGCSSVDKAGRLCERCGA
jgi:hypothetical protein